MIEVRAELQGLGVYLAGEWVTCTITFTNQGSTEETIAWAGAQLHCQFYCREDIVQVSCDQHPLPSPANDTAFIPNKGERGQTLLSTTTTVLVCNQTLRPLESRTVLYSEEVPTGGPPTFSGRLVKYVYKLAIGAQKPNCPAQIIRIPFRVMTIPDYLYSTQVVASPTSTNPFLTAEVHEHPALDLALQNLAMETSRKTTMNYTLKNSHGILGRISLFKPSYKLGEDITGICDLSTATVACLQLSVVLQCVEEVNADCRQPSAPVHSTHFQLPVPLSVTQSFKSNAVTIRWQLHFEFLSTRLSPDHLTQATPTVGLSGLQAELRRGLQPVAIDTMTWDLPLTILPTAPSLAEGRTPSQTLIL